MGITVFQVQLTDRDHTILRELSRWGAMRSDQLLRYEPGLFRSLSAVKERMRKLEAARYVHGSDVLGGGRPTVWMITTKGCKVLDLVRRGSSQKYLRLPHTLGLVDLWLALRTPDLSWQTERELWEEMFEGGRAKPGASVPDGAILGGTTSAGTTKREAVELELSAEGPGFYDKKMKWYANPYSGALSYGFHGCVYYTDKVGIRGRLERSIRRCGAAEMVRVEPVPPGVTINRWK